MVAEVVMGVIELEVRPLKEVVAAEVETDELAEAGSEVGGAVAW